MNSDLGRATWDLRCFAAPCPMTRVPSLMILIIFAGDPANNANIFAFFDGEGKMKMLANMDLGQAALGL